LKGFTNYKNVIAVLQICHLKKQPPVSSSKYDPSEAYNYNRAVLKGWFGEATAIPRNIYIKYKGAAIFLR
jgi:hypothetical protein